MTSIQNVGQPLRGCMPARSAGPTTEPVMLNRAYGAVQDDHEV